MIRRQASTPNKPCTPTCVMLRVLGAAALLALTGIALLHDARPGLATNAIFAEAPIEIEARDEATNPRKGVDVARDPPTASGFVPLPPLETPFAQSIDTLIERSAHGDGVAGCRLAHGYQRCRELPMHRRTFEEWLDDTSALPLDKSTISNKTIESIAQTLEQGGKWIARLTTDCEGVEVPSPAEQVRLWRQAALNGNLASMKQYASGNAFRWNSLMGALPELALYRQEAPAMALELARQGDIEMVVALAVAYAPQPSGFRSLLAQSVTPDAAMSLALYNRLIAAIKAADEPQSQHLLMQAERAVAHLSASLPRSELDRAQQIEEEQRHWIPPRNAKQRPLSPDGVLGDIESGECEQAPDT